MDAAEKEHKKNLNKMELKFFQEKVWSSPVVPKLRPAGRIRPASTFGPAPWTIPETHSDFFFILAKQILDFFLWRTQRGLFGYYLFHK